jgi:hypothetical protein
MASIWRRPRGGVGRDDNLEYRPKPDVVLDGAKESQSAALRLIVPKLWNFRESACANAISLIYRSWIFFLL